VEVVALDQLVQPRHTPDCGGLGGLIDFHVVRVGPFNTVFEIKVRWRCQKCMDTFETRLPYLEVLNLGD
jgi:hypothetical protein